MLLNIYTVNSIHFFLKSYCYMTIGIRTPYDIYMKVLFIYNTF